MQNKMFNEFRKHRTGMNDKAFAPFLLKFKKYFAVDNKAYLEGIIPIMNNEIVGLKSVIVLSSMDELV